MVNVEDMSDNELRSQLIQHGLKVGPVVGTTRKVYEKKLMKLLGSKKGATLSSMEHDFDDVNNDTYENGAVADDRMEGEESFRYVSPADSPPKKRPNVFQEQSFGTTTTTSPVDTGKMDGFSNSIWNQATAKAPYSTTESYYRKSAAISPRTATPTVPHVPAVKLARNAIMECAENWWPTILKMLAAVVVSIFLFMLFRRLATGNEEGIPEEISKLPA